MFEEWWIFNDIFIATVYGGDTVNNSESRSISDAILTNLFKNKALIMRELQQSERCMCKYRKNTQRTEVRIIILRVNYELHVVNIRSKKL